MLESLTDRISQAFGSLRSPKVLTEKTIDEALTQVRRSLLEADVALPVISEFLHKVRARVSGSQVSAGLTSYQTIVTIVHEELTRVMGEANVPLESSDSSPTVIMVTGLQGSGKTTTVGKLAKSLSTQEGKKVLVASIDVYRPAAIDQLKKTGPKMVEVDFFETDVTANPAKIATNAVAAGKKSGHDYVIVDTAGRLHIDEEMIGRNQNSPFKNLAH